jgi:isocitrate/isopropylmalate dehydrogenase
MLIEWAGRQGLIDKRVPTMRRSATLRSAITETVRNGPHTPDLGGNAATSEVTDAVLAHIKQTMA